ncbi:hypothetical protein JTB14_036081 [Gonioctena quinquepunctata]|nr:hypothetical protein JTB14_036081 [Gonioctena quinquepunctata]
MSDVGNVSFEMRSPSTSIASETVQIESKSETSKSRKRKKLHYFGGISFEDISNRSKRKISWSIIKKTIASQRKKSIILKQREREVCRRKFDPWNPLLSIWKTKG